MSRLRKVTKASVDLFDSTYKLQCSSMHDHHYTNLDTSSESRARPRATQQLCQVWRHITMSTVLTQEEIPEEGG